MTIAEPPEPATDNWPAVVMASAAVTVVTLDLYGINVALPTIQADVGASHTAASALVVAYSLSLTALLVPFGRVADRLGRRRVLLVGLGTFGLLSLGCAVANSTAALLVARTGQGAAAAAISATSLSVATVSVRRERRALALGLWTAITAAGATLGPPLAGLVVGEWSWRWFFALNAPLSLLFAGGVLVFVRESKMVEQLPSDRRGALAFIVGTTLVVTGITVSAAPGWPVVLPLLAGVVGAATLWRFVRLERRNPAALFDISVLEDRVYASTAVLAFGANWAYAALILYTPIYLQSSLGESPALSGAMLVAFTLLYAVWSPVVGRLIEGRNPAALVGAGLALIVVGLVLLALQGDGSRWLVIVALAVSALGQGLAFNTTGTVAMAAMGEDRAGVAAGLLSTIRQGGATVGLAVASAVYASVLATDTTSQAFDWVMWTSAAAVALSALALPFLGRTSPATVTDRSGVG